MAEDGVTRRGLPERVFEFTTTCPQCGRRLRGLHYVWPEAGSDQWQTQCGVCGYVWHERRE